jgi:hypothetical protein
LRERLEEEFKSEQSKQIKQASERQFSCYQDDENMWVIHARLPAEEDGLLVKLVAELGDQIALNHKDRERNLSDACSSDLSSKDVPAGTSVCDTTAMADNSAANIELLPFAQCRADALVAVAEQFLAQGDSGAALKSTEFKCSERCQ